MCVGSMRFKPRFLIPICLLMILTHARRSCCNSRQFYLRKVVRQKWFAWTAEAAAAALKEGEGVGWGGVFVIFGWIKKKRMCKWWHQEDRNLQIKISFSLLFQEGEAHRCKHEKTLIDHTAGGQRQPINYGSWSYLEILTMSWQWCKTTLWPWGRCCCCRVRSEGTEAIFIWCQTAELPNHELLRFISPISALSYQGRLEDHWSPW